MTVEFRSAFWEIGTALHWGMGDTVMSLLVYLDDSGGKTVRVLGGCIATFEDWLMFEAKWRQVLREFQVAWFHAAEFENGKGEFSGWATSKRAELSRRLVTVMNGHVIAYVGSVVPQRERAPLGQQPKGEARWALDWSRMATSPYCIAFASCLEAAISKVAVPRRKKLHIVLADQSGEIGSAALVYEAARLIPRFEPYLDELTQGTNPRDRLPLQAADLVAYELFKARTDKERWAYSQLKKRPCHFGAVRKLFERWIDWSVA